MILTHDERTLLYADTLGFDVGLQEMNRSDLDHLANAAEKAVRAKLAQAKFSYMDGYEGGKQEARDAAHEEIKGLTAERDAALARLAKIEAQEPIGYVYTIHGVAQGALSDKSLKVGTLLYAAAGAGPQLPLESSQEAEDAIAVVFKEYNYPANPANAARVGWRAARLYRSAGASQQPVQPARDHRGEIIDVLCDDVFGETYKSPQPVQPSPAPGLFRAGCKECARQKQANADNKEWQEGVKRGNEIVSAMARAAINAKETK